MLINQHFSFIHLLTYLCEPELAPWSQIVSRFTFQLTKGNLPLCSCLEGSKAFLWGPPFFYWETPFKHLWKAIGWTKKTTFIKIVREYQSLNLVSKNWFFSQIAVPRWLLWTLTPLFGCQGQCQALCPFPSSLIEPIQRRAWAAQCSIFGIRGHSSSLA